MFQKCFIFNLKSTTIMSLIWDNATEIRCNIFGGFGSEIQKVSRIRPTVSNETILAITQEFFVAKVAPVQNISDIVLFGFD